MGRSNLQDETGNTKKPTAIGKRRSADVAGRDRHFPDRVWLPRISLVPLTLPSPTGRAVFLEDFREK